MDKLLAFIRQYTKQNVPQLKSGDTVRVYERIKEKEGERIQVFEGLVIARKHGFKQPNATVTVRKISAHNIGVEKIFPIHSPMIQKIEIVKHDKVRRAKLYYLRNLIGKKKKRKASKMLGMVYEEQIEEPVEEVPAEQTKKTGEETLSEKQADTKEGAMEQPQVAGQEPKEQSQKTQVSEEEKTE
jgi:large subunit ribosomal protein L19